MISRKRGIRAMVLGLLAAAGLALAPAAFARTYVDVGINAPGVSVGYYGGHHHHGWYGSVGYGGYYAPYYYPSSYYYAPTYYDPYYSGRCYVRGHYDAYGYWHRGHYVSC
jgi:hypothetical protein